MVTFIARQSLIRRRYCVVRKSLLLLVLSLVVLPVLADECSILIPGSASVQLSSDIKCAPGQMCLVDPCAGTVKVTRDAVRIFFTNNEGRSDFTVIDSGKGSLNLSELRNTPKLTRAITAIQRILFGQATQSRTGGRQALPTVAVTQGIPAGLIVPGPNGLSFMTSQIRAGQVYTFHPQDNERERKTVTSDARGLFHIPASALQAGQRYRGGLQGANMVLFQVVPQQKLANVAAELAAVKENDAESQRYRRALIFFDNGLSWNAQQTLAEAP